MRELKNPETNTSDVEKIQNRRKQNFEGEANNKHQDKEDTQQSNLNGKHLSVTSVIKYPGSFILFLLCSGLAVKYNLILQCEALVNALGASRYNHD